MTFSKYASIVCARANGVVHSLKRLFYMPMNTKIQFFKTFIMPIFDYFLTLVIYFAKYVITKLSNCYYIIMAKLFDTNKSGKFNFSDKNDSEVEQTLTNYKLMLFITRVFIRLNMFIYKVTKHSKPSRLASCLKRQPVADTIACRLRSQLQDQLYVPFVNKDFGTKTFDFFGSIFYNNFLNNQSNLDIMSFKKTVLLPTNLRVCLIKFKSVFDKFDIMICKSYHYTCA